MRYRMGTLAATALSLALLPALPALAQGMKLREERPGLAKEALVSLKVARTTARAKVPRGKIKAQEIEMEGGKLIYSFDLKVKGQSGIEEVNVDAKTGDLVNQEHEGSTAEAKEKASDRAEAKHDAAMEPSAAATSTAKASK